MLSKGKQTTIGKQNLLDLVSECTLAKHYLNVDRIPCVIKSPVRIDNHPSLGLYTRDGRSVYYRDFATGEKGSFLELLSKLWSLDYNQVIDRIYSDINNQFDTKIKVDLLGYNKTNIHTLEESSTLLECKVRDWKNYDIEYWESYGITLDWLKYADVYPISHKIIIKDNKRMVFPADKYAYTFVEFKEGKTTHKFYQPFNKKGFKWQNNHDRSVISLWTKVPAKGDVVCICSSLKDALALWSNTGIPSLAVQGEGYPISQTAINNLKQRFKKQYVCLDNDIPGKKDAEKLVALTGFTNVEIPQFEGGKDISDYYKQFGKTHFILTFKRLFDYDTQ